MLNSVTGDKTVPIVNSPSRSTVRTIQSTLFRSLFYIYLEEKAENLSSISRMYVRIFHRKTLFKLQNQTCNQWDDPTFSGTDLANCQSAMASDIKTCQSKGKLVTLSLGGATGQVGFSSDLQAEKFAIQVWNLFLGGSSPARPFGDVVLDGYGSLLHLE